MPNSRFEWNIHFWLGIDTTLDEMATAAIKAVELDDHLGGTPVQYREVNIYMRFIDVFKNNFKLILNKVQMHESKLFHSYFEKSGGIRYLMGGVKSGFNSVGEIKDKKKLYMVKIKEISFI